LPHPIERSDVPVLQGLREPHSVGILDVENGRVITRLMPELQQELELLEVTENWAETKLITWLDRNIPHPDLPATETTVWLFAVVRELQQQGHSLGGLVRDRFVLRRVIEQRLAVLRQQAQRSHFQELLFTTTGAHRIHVGADHSFEFDPYGYPARWICPRSEEFRKHYYEKVGELKDRGEEFECAQRIDLLPQVAWWVRNLSRQPEFSFWLQTSSDRFYPDFVCRLSDGRVLVVEYKNEKDWSDDDNREKRALGELWAERSEGQCLFFMPRGRSDVPRLAELVLPFEKERLFDLVEDTPAPRAPQNTVAPKLLRELTRVRVRSAKPAEGVNAGEKGTIVHVYPKGGYEVEFTSNRARPAVVTVHADDVEALDT
jgi:type III restriction enzyme